MYNVSLYLIIWCGLYLISQDVRLDLLSRHSPYFLLFLLFFLLIPYWSLWCKDYIWFINIYYTLFFSQFFCMGHTPFFGSLLQVCLDSAYFFLLGRSFFLYLKSISFESVLLSPPQKFKSMWWKLNSYIPLAYVFDDYYWTICCCHQ